MYKKYNPSSGSYWNVIAQQYRLPDVLKPFKDIAIYGEIYGGRMQKGFDYCLVDRQKFLIFDAYCCKTNTWLGFNETYKIVCEMNTNPFKIEFEMVPIIYRKYGWNGLDEIKRFAEGPTHLGNKHVREGIVVESLDKAVNNRGIRMKFKLHGEGYLLHKHAVV
jgi:hypothetical protein